MHSRRVFLGVAACAVVASCSSARGGTAAAPTTTPAAGCPTPTAPQDGAYLGASLDWANQSLADYDTALGGRAAVAISFTPFPFTSDVTYVDDHVAQLAAQGGMLLLTLEPHDGLDTVTPEVAADLARRLAGWNASGVPVIVRFAHEMNGAWYAWGQQPAGYVAAFRLVAEAVHRDAPGSAMMWAPAYGGGYPFAGGPHEAAEGTADRAAMDTTGSGDVTSDDDPYAPYWPGADAVDWVGMSLYHWGDRSPYGDNRIPEPGKFLAQLTGRYDGLGGDDTSVPDFYATYGDGYDKPVAIPETAAFYAPDRGGEAELAIKQAWWRQVFDPALHERLPRLGLIGWFEWKRYETEVEDDVDWTLTSSPEIRDAFRADLPSWVRWADVPGCG